jgi:hypothetical protein
MFTTPLREEFNPFRGSLDLIPQDQAQIITVNSVGGGMFSTISSALTAISDNAANKQYILHCNGVFAENVTLKPFVHLVGVGNGPAAPVIVGKITATGYGANEYTLINRMGQSCIVASDGEVCNNWASPVIVNDFFASFTTDQNYGFTGIKQDCSGLSAVSTVMAGCQVLCTSTYDGSTKNIVALEQTGNGFGAGISSMTVQISAKASSGELIARKISVSGTAEYNSALCNIKVDNVKAASTATTCCTKVTSASTGYRIATNDQVRVQGNIASASAQCMDTGGNSGQFFAVGASVYIDPAITGYCANTALGDTQYVWLNSTSANYPTTGAGIAIVTPYALSQSGFDQWSTVAGNRWTFTASTGTFTLDNRFTGMVKSSPVVVAAGQSLTGATAIPDLAVSYVYADSKGVLKSSTATPNFEDNIYVAQVWRDGSNGLVTKENHPAKNPAATSTVLHDYLGTAFKTVSSSISGIAAAKMSFTGANVVMDHGIESTVAENLTGPTLTFVYVDGAGKMRHYATSATFPAYYNNAGTPTITTVGSNRWVVYRVGVIKDTNRTGAETAQWVAIMDTVQNTSGGAATTRITSNLVTPVPPELIALEFCQAGFIVVRKTSADAVDTTNVAATTALQRAGAQFLSGGTSTAASLITTDTSAFDVILSGADTSVQAALDTIDATAAKKVASSTDNAVVRFDSTSGQLLKNSVVIIADSGNITGCPSVTASTSVVTPLLKAYDANGIKFQENGGTEVGSVSDAGAWVMGASSFTGTHTIYGDTENIRDGSGSIFRFTVYASTATDRPVLHLRRSRGTLASPDQTLSGDSLGSILFYSQNGGTFYSQGGIHCVATADTTTASGGNLIFRDGSLVSKGEVNLSTGAWTLGPSSGNISHTIYTAANGGNADLLNIKTASALTTDGDENGVAVFGSATTAVDAVLGTYKHSGVTRATGYTSLRTNDNVLNYLWVDDSDQLRISTTAGHIGTTNGTVVGTQTSDMRLKSNISPTSYGLSAVLALNPVEFDKEGIHCTGFIAQQAMEVIPEAVFDTKEAVFGENEPSKFGMDYTQLIAPMVKAIQEQQTIIEDLRARLEMLEAK